MNSSILLLHHAAVLTLFVASLAKNILVWRNPYTASSAAMCLRADIASGIAAAVVVASGLTLLLLSPKGIDHYLSNSVFVTKMVLLLVASAFILRTKLFFRAKPQSYPVTVPRTIAAILGFDFVALIAIVLCGLKLSGVL